MTEMTSQEIIIRPLVTEKAIGQEEQHTYVFLVHPGVTKIQIRKAVEDIYKVHVRKVNTSQIRGRRRRYRGRRYLTPEVKKAMVTIAENERIEII